MMETISAVLQTRGWAGAGEADIGCEGRRAPLQGLPSVSMAVGLRSCTHLLKRSEPYDKNGL